MAGTLQGQLPTWVAGVQLEANTSNGEVEDASPKEDFDVVNHDQPQGEGNEAYDNKTQTKYHVNMILVGDEYHQRKHVFMAKHAKSDMPSASKQEPMYDHRLRRKTQDSQPDH
jgi:hypothetical protein